MLHIQAVLTMKGWKNMKKSLKRVLCIALCAVMLVCCMSAGASAYSFRTKYPFVFVHGLCGWGEDDGAYSFFPYWGMMTGNMLDELEAQGYECVVASVGTVSSAWDRACELYAQLTGGTVDYGAVHSKEHNHARYGKTFDEPIIDKWDANHKINLVGHSFGGATTRLFLQLLADGSAAERAATPENELSPLFKGGMSDRVYSLTALAAPHNGTSFFEAGGGLANVMQTIFYYLAGLCATSKLNNLFNPDLDHFGLTFSDDMTAAEKFKMIMDSDMMKGKDNAFYDLTIDGAAELNETLTVQPNVYYYSYAGSKTSLNEETGNQVPERGMNLLFIPFAYLMGRYTGKTAGGFVIDEKWKENDGLVNTVSALYPFDEPCKVYESGEKTQPGIWYVMPVEHMDHLSFSGGMMTVGWADIRLFYTKFMFIVSRSGK